MSLTTRLVITTDVLCALKEQLDYFEISESTSGMQWNNTECALTVFEQIKWRAKMNIKEC